MDESGREMAVGINPAERRQVLATCVGAAMAAVVFSALTGLLVPLFFRGVGVDPAVAAGPLIATLNDVFALGLLRVWE